MFSNLLRQQARLALSLRLATPLQNAGRSGLALQKPNLLSQRTFSISRTLFEEWSPEEKPNEARQSYAQKPGYIRNQSRGSGRVLYVGNLPYSAEESEVRELFSSYGEVKRVSLPTDAEGRQNGTAFVELSNHEEALRVVESGREEPFVLGDRDIRIAFAKSPPRDWNPPSNSLYIPNYPAPGDEGPLRELLADFEDKIVRISFVKDKAGRETDQTFVQFTDVETASIAFRTSRNATVRGTKLGIFYARDRLGQRKPRKPESWTQAVYDA